MANVQLDKKCMDTLTLVVVVLVLFFWVCYPNLQNSNEAFRETMSGAIGAIESEGPLLSEEQQFVMDGEGMEPTQVQANLHLPREPLDRIPENYYFLDDGSGGKMSIQHNLCSPSCCSEQYPTPFKMKYDPYVCQNKDKFVPSRIMCNNSFQDSGCLCMTKDQAKFMYNRGGNGREWF